MGDCCYMLLQSCLEPRLASATFSLSNGIPERPSIDLLRREIWYICMAVKTRLVLIPVCRPRQLRAYRIFGFNVGIFLDSTNSVSRFDVKLVRLRGEKNLSPAAVQEGNAKL